MSKPLVIVESPAKARTLSRLLGDEYRVEASVGHVRDLPENASEVPAEIKDKPWGRMGVDIENGFRPYYVIARDKAARIRELRSAVKDAPEVLLATDPDREGESISWHLREVLNPQVPIRRIEFHEITEEAVRRAIEEAREIDLKLVDAQESRRIVDRLYGYLVSPVLWKKVQTGLSAGRVQSVAVRLIVEREEERGAFRRSAYWDLEAKIRTADGEFAARLERVGGARLAIGRDFDTAGRLTDDRVRLLDEAAARTLRDALDGGLPWKVTRVEERPFTQRASAPFTTSTLQQEANRKLGYSADRTMSAAQRLFQEGIISYHRTDSTTLSERALKEAGSAIRDLYGAPFDAGPRQYKTKVKNAQEAHEAIRPTDFAQTPPQISARLGNDERRLYELIWKRAVASQMADARLLRTTIEITAEGPDGPGVFTASGKAIQFAGFLRAYVEGSDDPAAELGDQETILPTVTVGDEVTRDGPLALASLEPMGHETQPPARYTDASLVKRLEEDGIGRPSTYASIISTLRKREYVEMDNRRFIPTDVGRVVNRFLSQFFSQYVDYEFTARMEDDLDAVSRGEREWVPLLEEFWRPFTKLVEHTETNVTREQASQSRVLGADPVSGRPISVRMGRYGAFVQIGTKEDVEKPKFAGLRPGQKMDTIELQAALDLFKLPRELGATPEGEPVSANIGRFGPYVRYANKFVSIKGDDPYTITLERALQLIVEKKIADANRLILDFPDAGIQVLNGRYGPYITNKLKNAKIPKDKTPKELTLEQCQALLAAAPERRGRGMKRKPGPAAAPETAAAEAKVQAEEKKAEKKKKAKKKKKKAAAKRGVAVADTADAPAPSEPADEPPTE